MAAAIAESLKDAQETEADESIYLESAQQFVARAAEHGSRKGAVTTFLSVALRSTAVNVSYMDCVPMGACLLEAIARSKSTRSIGLKEVEEVMESMVGVVLSQSASISEYMGVDENTVRALALNEGSNGATNHKTSLRDEYMVPAVVFDSSGGGSNVVLLIESSTDGSVQCSLRFAAVSISQTLNVQSHFEIGQKCNVYCLVRLAFDDDNKSHWDSISLGTRMTLPLNLQQKPTATFLKQLFPHAKIVSGNVVRTISTVHR
jgi:hypothetical protein